MQDLKIDDHKRGAKEIKDWDDISADVHVDKRTKYKIDGKPQKVIIRIPINSDRPIEVEYNGNRNNQLPRQLRKEITQVLSSNEKKAKEFAKDIAETLKNYTSVLSDKEKAKQALQRISKHFDLEWTEQNIITYLNEDIEAYTQIYTDKNQKLYFITLNRRYIKLGDIDSWERHEIRLNRFR